MISHQRGELIEALEQRTLLSAIPLKDGLTANLHGGFITFGGFTYFSGRDAAHGWELWRTDGTSQGTDLVKDINSVGQGVVFSSFPQCFLIFNGTLLFVAKYGPAFTDVGLWRTDGTEASTEMLFPNIDPLNGLELEGWYPFKGKLIGLGTDGLVETDGTAQGTRLVVSDPDSDSLVATEDRVYWLFGTRFTDTYRVKSWDGQVVRTEATAGEVDSNVPTLTSSFGYGIRFQWHNDSGSSGATVQLAPRDIVVRPFHESFHNRDNNDDIEFRGMRFYTDDQSDLYRVGTEPSQDVLLNNIRRGSLTVSGNRLFFVDADANTELWSTDGTTEGTVLVRQFAPAQVGYIFGSDRRAYFTVEDASDDAYPWRSDGSAAGTIQLALPQYSGNTSIFGFGQHNSSILIGTLDRLWGFPVAGPPIRAPRPSLPSEVLRITGTGGNDDVRIGSFVQDGNDLTELDVLGTR